MAPFAFRVGFRRSVETSSCRYAFGSAQSHSVMTTLRSIPRGRGGAGGTSPFAMRSVQSANIVRARGPSPLMLPIMLPPAWPDCRRRSHASRDELNLPSEGGNSRVALLPSWWHARQVPDLMLLRKSPCDLMSGEMPLPAGPVPGNSLSFGGSMSENQ